MENGTIGGNLFSLISEKKVLKKISPSLFVSDIIAAESRVIEIELVEHLSGEWSGCFEVKINKIDGSVIASTIIKKETGKIVKVQPQNKDERLKIFGMVFSGNMLNFSESYGMLPLDLILCISMLYENNNNLRLFFQQIYEDRITDTDIYRKIYDSISSDTAENKTRGIVVNILGIAKEKGHVDVLVKLDNDNFRIFDTAWNSPLFDLFYDIADNLSRSTRLCGNENKIFLIDKQCFQGPMSCFLMILSFLEVCEKNPDFLENIERYFKNNVGHFMILQQLLALISDDKDILNLEIEDNGNNIKISKISSKFISKNKTISEDFFVPMKWFNKYIPLRNLVNKKALESLLSNLSVEIEIIEHKKPDFISEIQKKESEIYSEYKEYTEDERYFQALLNKYSRILYSELNKNDYYFDADEQNILVPDFIDTTILSRLNNGDNIIFGYREDIRQLMPEFDTNIRKGNPVNFIYTLGTKNNQNADAGTHYVAAQAFINPDDNRLTILHYDALNGKLNQEFIDYIHSNFGTKSINIINIPLIHSLRQLSNNTCGLYALTALRDGGILDREREAIILKYQAMQQQDRKILEDEYNLPKQRRRLEKLVHKGKVKQNTGRFLRKEIDKMRTKLRKKEREVKQKTIGDNSWEEKENVRRKKISKVREL